MRAGDTTNARAFADVILSEYFTYLQNLHFKTGLQAAEK